MTSSSNGRWLSSSVSTSSSRKRAAILRPSRTATSSSTTSARRRPSPSRSAVCRLTVLSRTCGWRVAFRTNARTRSTASVGGRRESPANRYSSRTSIVPSLVCGSFTVQPSLERWRRLTPQRVSRRSSVSRYVADTRRAGSVSANTPSADALERGQAKRRGRSELDLELGHDRARRHQVHAPRRAPAGARGRSPRSSSAPCAIRRVGAPRRARRLRG